MSRCQTQIRECDGFVMDGRLRLQALRLRMPSADMSGGLTPDMSRDLSPWDVAKGGAG